MIKLEDKKIIIFIIPVIIFMALIASFVTMPSLAQEPLPGEKPEPAPLNPEYEVYLQDPPGEFYGYIPPPVNLSHLRNISVERQSFHPLGLPSSFDWRTSNNVTSVKNQSSCGTCWIFGTLSAVEAKVLIEEGTAYDFSEQNVACCTDPSWVYLHVDRCKEGGWSWLAVDTLAKKGTRLESCDPYDTDNITSDTCNDSCDTIKLVTGYRMVDPTTALIKDAVFNYGPVSMAFYWDDSYYYPEDGYTYYYTGSSYPNHLVCIVGWDDYIPHPVGGGLGAWIVKNNWDTTWGDEGYFYLCYGSGNMEEVAYYEYRDYDSLEKIYYWDEAGWVWNLGYDTGDITTAWMANVFTVTEGGYLTHVDFWTTSNNAAYQIYVYNDGSPSNGLDGLLATQSGTCQEAGYYSIELDSPVPVSTSQQFSVAVKMTTPGYDAPIPAEGEWQVTPPPTTMCSPTIQTGVSYARHGDADPWADLANINNGYNACLRARIYSQPAFVSTIDIVDKGGDNFVTDIIFPEGQPGFIISTPYNNYNGSGDPQVLAGSGSEPVVRIKNISGSSLKIWLQITAWTGVVSSERYELVTDGTHTVDAVTTSLSADGGSATVDTTKTINDLEYGDLYLEITLNAMAGKSGNSIISILGENI